MDGRIFHLRKIIYLNSRILFLILFSIFLVSSPVFCEKQKSKSTQELLVWQQRVDELTDGIIQDSKSVGDSERAMYLALLAKMWWKSDPDEARGYLNKAAVLMLSDLRSDDEADLVIKLEYAQKTIKIVAALDEKLSQSLVGELEKILKDRDVSSQENTEMADLFAKLGLQMVDTNPRMAFAAALDSVIYGTSLHLPKLIMELNLKDPKLAEQIFQSALAAARRKYNYSFMGTLGNYLFEAYKGKAMSDEAKRAYLGYLSEILAGAATVEAERSRCDIVNIIAPIFNRFDEYLPTQSQIVRQQVPVCIPFSHPFTAEITRAEANGDGPQTVDEFIQAARDTRDRALKGRYFSRAISMLAKAKRFDDVISLLDDMHEDECKVMSFIWDEWRADYSALSAMAYFENKDMPSVYRIIAKTPKRVRPYARFRIVYKLSPGSDREFYLENLEEIQKELGSIEIPARDAASNYLTLARLYLKIQPTESEAMFRNAVKYINKTDSDNPDFEAIKDWAPLFDYVPLSAELLETDESGINSSLNNISSRRSRVRLKLGLLESCLQKLADVKKKVEAESKKAIKEK